MESRFTISSTIIHDVGLHIMNSNSRYNDFFFPARCYAQRGIDSV